ncbi:testis-expressed basic protein 1 [Herpailurus yagouaroundi]|uniref:testis-expressed basic protein 1 n=1 Tax=Herpailurus yagouaroundi TaxID=1608482 RepID=UPI001AD76588|nr:testis-expressed basic protein 1 [Puma yagouaroundi]
MAVLEITLAVILTLLGLVILAILLTRWTRRKQNEIDVSRYSSEQSAGLLDYEDGRDFPSQRSKRGRGFRHLYSTESDTSYDDRALSQSSIALVQGSMSNTKAFKATSEPLSGSARPITGVIGPIMQFTAPIPGGTGPIKLSQKTIVQTPGPIVQYTGPNVETSEMTTTESSLESTPHTNKGAVPPALTGPPPSVHSGLPLAPIMISQRTSSKFFTSQPVKYKTFSEHRYYIFKVHQGLRFMFPYFLLSYYPQASQLELNSNVNNYPHMRIPSRSQGFQMRDYSTWLKTFQGLGTKRHTITPLPQSLLLTLIHLIAEITVCLQIPHTCFTCKAQNLLNGCLKRTEGKGEQPDAGYKTMLSVGFDEEKIEPALIEGSDSMGKPKRQEYPITPIPIVIGPVSAVDSSGKITLTPMVIFPGHTDAQVAKKSDFKAHILKNEDTTKTENSQEENKKTLKKILFTDSDESLTLRHKTESKSKAKGIELEDGEIGMEVEKKESDTRMLGEEDQIKGRDTGIPIEEEAQVKRSESRIPQEQEAQVKMNDTGTPQGQGFQIKQSELRTQEGQGSQVEKSESKIPQAQESQVEKSESEIPQTQGSQIEKSDTRIPQRQESQVKKSESRMPQAQGSQVKKESSENKGKQDKNKGDARKKKDTGENDTMKKSDEGKHKVKGKKELEVKSKKTEGSVRGKVN